MSEAKNNNNTHTQKQQSLDGWSVSWFIDYKGTRGHCQKLKMLMLRNASKVQVSYVVCAFGCCFVGANGLLVDVCQCCCLLMFVCLPLSRHFPCCKTWWIKNLNLITRCVWAFKNWNPNAGRRISTRVKDPEISQRESASKARRCVWSKCWLRDTSDMFHGGTVHFISSILIPASFRSNISWCRNLQTQAVYPLCCYSDMWL